MPVPAFVQGDLRIQFLSPNVVRIERRGPKGFEDRPTFTAVGRKWPGVKAIQQGANLVTKGYTVALNGAEMKGIRIVVGGRTVYTVGELPKTSWLPDPGRTGPVWALADSPRLVPPPGGAIPANLGGMHERTSGYDVGNDAPDLYLFVTKDPQILRREFLRLTGPVPLVPRYTFGFWDSLYYAYTEKTALATIDEYRRRGLPLDLFVCDTDWRVGASKGYGVDETLFPDMTRFLRAAHARGVRIMFNDHPEPQAETALDPQETVYRWNGLTDLLRKGVDVWWYDRNWSTRLREPMPGIRPEVWGASVFHDVTQAFRPQNRPLVMSNVDGIDNGVRNGPPHPAFHRYPIWWTGDTESNWTWLRYAVANGVDEGAIGMLPYVNEDLGGHRGDPSPELYTRFLQYGAFSPVMRVHATAGKTRYPWAFGPEALRATTEAIRFRYALIPTLYSASFRTATDGMPLLRRLDLYWPQEKEASATRQFLLGDDLLVSPVTASDAPEMKPLTGPFRGEFFADTELQSTPVLTRESRTIDFDWGQGSPGTGVPKDAFSARWTGRTGPFRRAGTYRFGTSSDDGVRLWIDGKKIIDAWGPANSEAHTGAIRLEAGKAYDLRLEYQELDGGANVHLVWEGDDAPRKGPMPWTFWCPPGKWINPWTGTRLVGPRSVTMPADLRRVPLLIRDGAILFLGDTRVRASDEQLRKPLTVEAYPSETATKRSLVEDDGISTDAPRTVRTATASRTATGVRLALSPAKGPGGARDFVVRVHLRAGEKPVSVTRDGFRTAYALQAPKGTAAGLGEVFAARGGAVVVVSLKGLPPRGGTTVEIRTQ